MLCLLHSLPRHRVASRPRRRFGRQTHNTQTHTGLTALSAMSSREADVLPSDSMSHNLPPPYHDVDRPRQQKTTRKSTAGATSRTGRLNPRIKNGLPERLTLHSNGLACVKSNPPAQRRSNIIHHNSGEVLQLGTGRKLPNDNALTLTNSAAK